MNDRVNSFAGLANPPPFKPKPKSESIVADDALDRIAEDHDFPSRPAVRTQRASKRKRRIYRTGRNITKSVKMTFATEEKFNRLADEYSLVLGDLLDKALDAFEAGAKGKDAPQSKT